jgi:hypothetical protein
MKNIEGKINNSVCGAICRIILKIRFIILFYIMKYGGIAMRRLIINDGKTVFFGIVKDCNSPIGKFLYIA